MTARSGQYLLALTVAVVAVVTGLVVRLTGLGVWPFEVDEYYLTKAVTSILDSGLPNFECGGFYTRGLLQQYVSAGLVLAIENRELAMRLYPMALNIAAIGVAGLLGRRLGGPVAGLVVLALMSLSLWEIEFARFARMYAPFQFLTLLQLYLFVRVVFDRRHALFKWMLSVGAFAIVTYEAALFLMLPVIVALFRVPSLRRPAPLFATGAVAACAIAYVLTPFRTLGVQQTPLPAELTAMLAPRPGAIVSLPDLAHVGQLLVQPLWLAGLVILSIAALSLTLRHRRQPGPLALTAWLVALACQTLSMIPLGLIVYLATVFLLLDADERPPALGFLARVVLPVTVVLLLFWSAYLMLGPELSPKAAGKVLLKYPNLLDPVAYVFMDAVPVLCAVLLAPVVVYGALVITRADARRDEFVTLAALAVTLLVGVALLSPNSHETRYSFFVYPVVLCLFVLASQQLAGMLPARLGLVRTGWPLILVAAFTATEDFSVRHYRGIDTAEINFRNVYRSDLQEHFKYRDDNRSPARYVNQRLKPGDTVIIAESGVDIYADQVDYRYKHASGKDFVNHVSCGLEHDVWSNAPVLYSEERLREAIAAATGTVWIIKRNFEEPSWLGSHQVFLAADDRMQVIALQPAGTPVSRVTER